MGRIAVRLAFLPVVLAVAVSCGGGAGRSHKTEPRERPFPSVQVPAVYSDPGQRLEYLAGHFWDDFFALNGATDSARVIGVSKGEVEQNFANYLAILDMLPLDASQKGMARLFSLLSAKQQADTSSRVYLAMTEIVSRYLYDPNSPLRDEDYYYPFVKRMAESPLTRDDMRRACQYEASQCAMNPRGSIAPDFEITCRNGSRFRLHGVKADYVILFFSNPGCNACKEITVALMEDAMVQRMLGDGSLAVVNVYIDEDLDAWRRYEPEFPREWHNGYDASQCIRGDELYSVRAIPSLYLLDGEKRVLLKDAPVEKVLGAISQNNSK